MFAMALEAVLVKVEKNTQAVPSAGNLQPVASAGKQALPSAGKLVTGAKRGKTCVRQVTIVMFWSERNPKHPINSESQVNISMAGNFYVTVMIRISALLPTSVPCIISDTL